MYRLQEGLSTCLATLVPEVFFSIQLFKSCKSSFNIYMNKTNQLQIKLQNFEKKTRERKIWKLVQKTRVQKLAWMHLMEFNEGILKNINIHLLLIYIDKID